jgi:hypothetical protein
MIGDGSARFMLLLTKLCWLRPSDCAVARTSSLRILVVWIALTSQSAVGQCPGDFDRDGAVAIHEIITTIRNSLEGCAAPGPRFVNNGDGTITDQQMGLMWEQKVERDDRRPSWAGSCINTPGTYCQPNVEAAALCAAHADGAVGCGLCSDGGACAPSETVWEWAADLNRRKYGGHADWRIPTREELRSIVDYAAVASPVVDEAFNGADCGTGCFDIVSPACSCTQVIDDYWTASVFAPIPYIAWTVGFGNGALSATIRTEPRFVRAVRDVSP